MGFWRFLGVFGGFWGNFRGVFEGVSRVVLGCLGLWVFWGVGCFNLDKVGWDWMG